MKDLGKKNEKKNNGDIKELFDDREVAISEPLKINQAFAKKFEARKDKEELGRLMNNPRLRNKVLKRSDDPFSEEGESSDDSEEEEEEDSDAELVTNEVGAKVLETISKIKMKTKEIYDKDKQFFDADDFDKVKEKKQEAGALTFSRFLCSTLKKVNKKPKQIELF